MSLTAEDVRRRIEESRRAQEFVETVGPEATQKVMTAAAIRRQLAERYPESIRSQAIAAEFAEQSPWEQALVGAGRSAIRAYMGGKALFTDLSPEDQQLVRDFEAMRGRPGTLGEAAGTAGGVAGTVGMMAVPGSQAYRGAQALTRSIPVARTVAPLAAESTVAGGIEALDAPLRGQEYLPEAAKTAALNYAIGTGMAGARAVAVPGGFPKSRRAQLEEASQRAVGVEPRLPLSIAAEPTGPAGKTVQWFHRQPLRALPGLGGVLRRQTDEFVDDWRESMLLRALPERGRAEVPMPRTRTGAEAPIQDTFRDIDQWYKAQYDDILGDQRFSVTSGPGAERVTEAYVDLPGAARDEVAQYTADLVARKVDEFGGLSGDAISDIKKTLRRRSQSLTVDPDVQIGYQNVIEALDDVVEDTLRATNPEDALRYAELRPAYRNLVTLEKAASRGEGKAYGEFTPNDLLEAAASKGKRELGERAVSQGRVALQTEAQRAKALMEPIPKKQQESNAFQLGALLGITGFGGLTAPAVTGGLWAGMLASVPRGTQRYLMAERPYQRGLAWALRQRPTREMTRAGRLGATEYYSED